MSIQREVKGLPELNRFFDQFPEQLKKNVMRGALRAGCAEVLLPEVRANIERNGSIDSGEYRDGLRVGTRSNGDTVTGYVRAGGKHAFLGPWLEFGVVAHMIAAKVGGFLSFGGIFAKKVAHPGIHPRPHFRPAVDSRGGAAVAAAAAYTRAKLATRAGLETSTVQIGDEP